MMLPDEQRILRISEYCERIRNTVLRYGNSYDVFLKDSDYQQSIAFSILQIAELSSDLSEKCKNTTSGMIPWRSIKGMRNTVLHGYEDIDLELVWHAVKNDIPELKAFCDSELTGHGIGENC